MDPYILGIGYPSPLHLGCAGFRPHNMLLISRVYASITSHASSLFLVVAIITKYGPKDILARSLAL